MLNNNKNYLKSFLFFLLFFICSSCGGDQVCIYPQDDSDWQSFKSTLAPVMNTNVESIIGADWTELKDGISNEHMVSNAWLSPLSGKEEKDASVIIGQKIKVTVDPYTSVVLKGFYREIEVRAEVKGGNSPDSTIKETLSTTTSNKKQKSKTLLATLSNYIFSDNSGTTGTTTSTDSASDTDDDSDTEITENSPTTSGKFPTRGNYKFYNEHRNGTIGVMPVVMSGLRFPVKVTMASNSITLPNTIPITIEKLQVTSDNYSSSAEITEDQLNDIINNEVSGQSDYSGPKVRSVGCIGSQDCDKYIELVNGSGLSIYLIPNNEVDSGGSYQNPNKWQCNTYGGGSHSLTLRKADGLNNNTPLQSMQFHYKLGLITTAHRVGLYISGLLSVPIKMLYSLVGGDPADAEVVPYALRKFLVSMPINTDSSNTGLRTKGWNPCLDKNISWNSGYVFDRPQGENITSYHIYNKKTLSALVYEDNTLTTYKTIDQNTSPDYMINNQETVITRIGPFAGFTNIATGESINPYISPSRHVVHLDLNSNQLDDADDVFIDDHFAENISSQYCEYKKDTQNQNVCSNLEAFRSSDDHLVLDQNGGTYYNNANLYSLGSAPYFLSTGSASNFYIKEDGTSSDKTSDAKLWKNDSAIYANEASLLYNKDIVPGGSKIGKKFSNFINSGINMTTEQTTKVTQIMDGTFDNTNNASDSNITSVLQSVNDSITTGVDTTGDVIDSVINFLGSTTSNKIITPLNLKDNQFKINTVQIAGIAIDTNAAGKTLQERVYLRSVMSTNLQYFLDPNLNNLGISKHMSRCVTNWTMPQWMLNKIDGNPLSVKGGFNAISGVYFAKDGTNLTKNNIMDLYDIKNVWARYGGIVNSSLITQNCTVKKAAKSGNIADGEGTYNVCKPTKFTRLDTPEFKTHYPLQIILFKNIGNDPLNSNGICTFILKDKRGNHPFMLYANEPYNEYDVSNIYQIPTDSTELTEDEEAAFLDATNDANDTLTAAQSKISNNAFLIMANYKDTSNKIYRDVAHILRLKADNNGVFYVKGLKDKNGTEFDWLYKTVGSEKIYQTDELNIRKLCLVAHNRGAELNNHDNSAMHYWDPANTTCECFSNNSIVGLYDSKIFAKLNTLGKEKKIMCKFHFDRYKRCAKQCDITKSYTDLEQCIITKCDAIDKNFKTCYDELNNSNYWENIDCEIEDNKKECINLFIRDGCSYDVTSEYNSTETTELTEILKLREEYMTQYNENFPENDNLNSEKIKILESLTDENITEKQDQLKIFNNKEILLTVPSFFRKKNSDNIWIKKHFMDFAAYNVFNTKNLASTYKGYIESKTDGLNQIEDFCNNNGKNNSQEVSKVKDQIMNNLPDKVKDTIEGSSTMSNINIRNYFKNTVELRALIGSGFIKPKWHSAETDIHIYPKGEDIKISYDQNEIYYNAEKLGLTYLTDCFWYPGYGIINLLFRMNELIFEVIQDSVNIIINIIADVKKFKSQCSGATAILCGLKLFVMLIAALILLNGIFIIYMINNLLMLATLIPLVVLMLSANNQNQYFIKNMPQYTERECGTSTAFQVVPISPMFCIKGYKKFCSNKRLENYAFTFGTENTSDIYIDRYCIETKGTIDTQFVGTCEITLKDSVTKNIQSTKVMTRLDNSVINNFDSKDKTSLWDSKENIMANQCGVCVQKNSITDLASINYISELPDDTLNIKTEAECNNYNKEGKSYIFINGYKYLPEIDDIQIKAILYKVTQPITEISNEVNNVTDANLTAQSIYRYAVVGDINNCETKIISLYAKSIKNIADEALKNEIIKKYSEINSNKRYTILNGICESIKQDFESTNSNNYYYDFNFIPNNRYGSCIDDLNISETSSTIIADALRKEVFNNTEPINDSKNNVLSKIVGSKKDNYFDDLSFTKNIHQVNKIYQELDKNFIENLTNLFASNVTNGISAYSFESSAFENSGIGQLVQKSSEVPEGNYIITLPNNMKDENGNLVEYVDIGFSLITPQTGAQNDILNNNLNILERAGQYDNSEKGRLSGYKVIIGDGVKIQRGKYMYMYFQPYTSDGVPDEKYNPNKVFHPNNYKSCVGPQIKMTVNGKDEIYFCENNGVVRQIELIGRSVSQTKDYISEDERTQAIKTLQESITSFTSVIFDSQQYYIDVSSDPRVYHFKDYDTADEGEAIFNSPRTGKIWYTVLDVPLLNTITVNNQQIKVNVSSDTDGFPIVFTNSNDVVTDSTNYAGFNMGTPFPGYKVYTSVSKNSVNITDYIKNQGGQDQETSNIIYVLVIKPIKTLFFGSYGKTSNSRYEYDYVWEEGFIYKIIKKILSISIIYTLFYMAVVLSILIMGINILFGKEQFSLKEIKEQMIRIFIVMAFTSPNSWKIYFDFVVRPTLDLFDGLAMILASSFTPTMSSSINRGSYLDILFGPMNDTLSFFINANNWRRLIAIMLSSVVGFIPMILILGSMMFFSTLCIGVTISHLVILVILCIYLAMGPLAIMCLIKKETSKITMNWLKKLGSLIAQNSMMFSVFALFGYLFTNLLKGLLDIIICWQDIITIDLWIYKLTLLSGWRISGTIPPALVRFMGESTASTDLTKGTDSNILIASLILPIILIVMMKFIDECIAFAAKLFDGEPDMPLGKSIESMMNAAKGIAEKIKSVKGGKASAGKGNALKAIKKGK